jgi:hypothetical protein
MGHVRALPTVPLSTADPGAPIAHVRFLRNAAGPETEPAAIAPAFKETDGGRTKPDEFSSPQPTTVSNKTGAGVH